MVFVKDELSGDVYTAMAFSYNKQKGLVTVVFEDSSVKQYQKCHCKAEVSMGIIVVTISEPQEG